MSKVASDGILSGSVGTKQYHANLGILLAITLLYFLAGKLGLMVALVQQNTSPVWPPSGVAIAAMMLFGYRVWPAIFTGALLINLTTALPVWAPLLIGVGNTLEAATAVCLLRMWLGKEDPLGSINSLLKFIMSAAVLAPVVSATIGVSVLTVSNPALAEQFRTLWLTWWSGDATGVLIVAPALLVWGLDFSLRTIRARGLEFIIMLLVTVLLTSIAFGKWFAPVLEMTPVTFLTIPPAIWAAFRFGRHGSTLVIIIISCLAVWATVHGYGPYVRESINQSLILLQAFISMVSVATLVLTGLVEQRDRVGRELAKANEKLTERVNKQNIELVKSDREISNLSKHQDFILQSSRDGFLIMDIDGTIQQVNDAFCGLIGFKVDYLTGKKLQSLSYPDDMDRDAIQNCMEEAGQYGYKKCEFGLCGKSGCRLDIDCSFSIVNSDETRQYFVYVRDITAKRKSEKIIQALATQSMDSTNDESFFRDCLVNLAEFYGTKFAFIGLLTGKNPATVKTYSVYADGNFVENFEYDLIGTPCWDVINLNSEIISTHAAELYPDDEMLIQMGIDSYFGAPLVSRDNTMLGLVTVMDVKPLYLDEWAKNMLEIFAKRIAFEMERKRIDDELHGMSDLLSYQASHDSLTNLINRREFDIRLQHTLDSAHRDGKQHALCYMDLDQFKVVNDTCGHIAGDSLLKQLSIKIPEVIRDMDTLARLGGDEFGVLLYDCPIDKAWKIAEKLQNTVRSFRFVWQDNIFEIGVSIGLVPLNKSTRNISEAMIAADAACYMAKEHGRNRIHVFQEDDDELVKRKGEMQWVSRIHAALDEKRFVLYVQSIMSLSDDIKDRHFEVLVRMRGDEGELIPPGAFIPAAERYNLMLLIDREVIRCIFDWFDKHPEMKEQVDMCTINISAQSLIDDSFLEFLYNRLKHSDVPTDIFCFEITETEAVANLTRAVHFIKKIKSVGCAFALDDFGSGMSSFAYLKTLPVDYLKIDGNFVRDIADDPVDYAMVNSIHQVGNVMGLKTIAEFVENDPILNKLRQIGVDYAQGFGVAKPVPIDSLLD